MEWFLPFGLVEPENLFSVSSFELIWNLNRRLAETNDNVGQTSTDTVGEHRFQDSHNQTVHFSDLSYGDVTEFEAIKDSSFYDGEIPSAQISKFFERPILIKSYSWTSSGFSPSDNYFDPWTLFLNNTAIKYKLNNYSFASMRLHVKFVVNAAPFYYGARIASYQPLPTLSPHSNIVEAGGSIGRIAASQRPNVWIMPQSNEAGEMILPFFYQKNWLPITSASEVAKMGRIYWTDVLALTSANGATTNGATVQVFAWASDVHLAGPTVALAMQGRDSPDEYGVGPISRPASAIAVAAKYFTKIPWIAPYARATEIGASAVSKIASLFGWTNVPVIADAMPFKSLPFHSITSAHVSEPVAKLTLDPKGELTVDPVTVGLCAEDELSIPYIVQKESYLTQATWATTSSPNTLLFQSYVTASMFQQSGASGGGTYTTDFTPMGHLSCMFNNWHGDIIFRFKVVCSKFHRGRLQITWDPVGDLYTNGITATTNTSFTTIVDITDTTDISVRIPYLQAKPWLETCNVLTNFGAATPYQIGSFSALGATARSNGTITVRVLTNLSAPIDVASVALLVFVKGAENLEFANPVDVNWNASTFAPQGKDESDEETIVEFGEDVLLPNRFKINYGEAVPSMRLLLRRASLVDVIPLNFLDVSNKQIMFATLGFHKYPPMPGFDTTNGNSSVKGWETTANTYKYMFTKMTPFNWMQACYVACRGGMRWHFNVDAQGKQPLHTMRVTRNNNDMSPYPATSAGWITTTQLTSASRSQLNYIGTLLDAGISGQVLTNQLTQTSLSVELPQMNNNRFVTADPTFTYAGQAEDNTDRETYNFTLMFKPQESTCADYVVTRFAGIGTDFNFFFYLNAPRIYTNNSSFVIP